MTNRQKKQIDLLNFMGNEEAIIDLRESICCACDMCGTYWKATHFYEVLKWLRKHEDHETRVWIEGIRKIKTINKTIIIHVKEHIIDKIQKLYRLAGNNPYKEEVKSALLKAQELLMKYDIDEEELKND